MNEYSIEISDVSKVYKLYENSNQRLKEAFNLFGKKYHTEFVALQDVSLRIRRGETFSLVGRNGAGKSTLLKVLSGVVSPTSGKITVNGRIVALLELGAGFNNEMSGAENIFMFGAFHGYSHSDMAELFGEIVQFADIGEFINYPVKTYSSGMFVRLAFACSVHLKPDVLVVDEALSVGDAKFQQKCFKFIDSLKENGTTIILVSHDLSLIKMVSQRACLIDHGKVLFVGDPKDVANKYFDLNSQDSPEPVKAENVVASVLTLIDESTLNITPGSPSFGDRSGEVKSILLKTSTAFPFVSGKDKLVFTLDASWEVNSIKKVAESGKYKENMIFGVSLSDKYGNYIFGMTTVDKDRAISIDSGRATISFEVNMPELKSDDYLLNASLALGVQAHHVTIAWYESIHIVQYRSTLKNVYGWMHPEYFVR